MVTTVGPGDNFGAIRITNKLEFYKFTEDTANIISNVIELDGNFLVQYINTNKVDSTNIIR